MRSEFDVDIDVKSSTNKKAYGTQAMVYNSKTEKVLPHPAGFYLEPVPIDDTTGNCAFDYKFGSEFGFFKVDLLTNTVYDGFKTKEEVLEAATGDVDWDKFGDERIVAQLPHIANHFDIIRRVNPRSIDDLADVLALIRPGKRPLLDRYIKSKDRTRHTLYKRANNDLNYFKKSHAYSYALMIIVALYKISNPVGIQWK